LVMSKAKQELFRIETENKIIRVIEK